MSGAVSPARRGAGAVLLLSAPLLFSALATARAAERTFALDPAKSALTFTVSRPGETIPGRAPGLSGTIKFDPDHPDAGASVRLRVKAESLETGNSLRDRKMRGSHLEVERFPEIVFESTCIDMQPPASEPLAAGRERKSIVEGRLDLHGVSRTVKIPIVIRYDNGSVSASGEVAFKLSDHAIAIPRFLWLVLEDNVTVSFTMVAAGTP